MGEGRKEGEGEREREREREREMRCERTALGVGGSNCCDTNAFES